MDTPFCRTIEPDADELLRILNREGAPERVHFIELFLDIEVQDAVCERFDLLKDLNPSDPYFNEKKHLILQRFLGYDFVRAGLEGIAWQLRFIKTEDSSTDLKRTGGRDYIDERRGPITNWEEFEAYPWPDATRASTRALDWYEENLPDDMCIIPIDAFSHYAEYLNWLMGYETLCIALYDQPDLVLLFGGLARSTTDWTNSQQVCPSRSSRVAEQPQ